MGFPSLLGIPLEQPWPGESGAAEDQAASQSDRLAWFNIAVANAKPPSELLAPFGRESADVRLPRGVYVGVSEVSARRGRCAERCAVGSSGAKSSK